MKTLTLSRAAFAPAVLGLLLLNGGAAHAETRLSAELQWLREVPLSLPQAGVVTQVLVQAGERVKAGQTLLKLDARAAQAELNAAQAILARAKAAQQETQRELERTQELFDQVLISVHEMELAKNAYTAAQADTAHAEAALAQAKLALEYTELRAPFAGLVSARLVEPGQSVTSQCQPQPLLHLAESPRMLAVALLGVEQLAQFQPGQKLHVEVADQTYPATVRSLGLRPQASPSGPQYPLHLLFEPANPLRPGLPATVVGP